MQFDFLKRKLINRKSSENGLISPDSTVCGTEHLPRNLQFHKGFNRNPGLMEYSPYTDMCFVFYLLTEFLGLTERVNLAIITSHEFSQGADR